MNSIVELIGCEWPLKLSEVCSVRQCVCQLLDSVFVICVIIKAFLVFYSKAGNTYLARDFSRYHKNLVEQMFINPQYYSSALLNRCRSLRYLFCCLQQNVKDRWSENEIVRSRVVRWVLALFTLCLQMLSPIHQYTLFQYFNQSEVANSRTRSGASLCLLVFASSFGKFTGMVFVET